MEDLSPYGTQVATVLTLFEVALDMLRSIRTKNKTKKLIAISSSMILLKELTILLASFLQPILRN